MLAGWSCSDPGPAQFDGTFSLQQLPVGSTQNYQIYAEPMDGPVILGNVIYNFTSLCRNATSDPVRGRTVLHAQYRHLPRHFPRWLKPQALMRFRWA